MRYLKILLAIIRINFQRELEYRTKFIVWIVMEVLWLFWYIILFSVLFRFTDRIVGWNQAEMLIYVGFYKVIKGVFDTLFYTALISFPESVSRGELDFTLVRPVSSQFLVSIRQLYFSDFFQVVLGVGVILFGRSQLDYPILPVNLIFSLISAVAGVGLLYVFTFLGSIVSVFAVRLTALGNYHLVLKSAIRYPSGIFYSPGRILSVLVFVLSLFITLPASLFLGKSDGLMLIPQLLITLVLLLVVNRLWHFALRHYSSASS